MSPLSWFTHTWPKPSEAAASRRGRHGEAKRRRWLAGGGPRGTATPIEAAITASTRTERRTLERRLRDADVARIRVSSADRLPDSRAATHTSLLCNRKLPLRRRQGAG